MRTKPPKPATMTHKQLAKMWEGKYWDLLEKINRAGIDIKITKG